MKFFSREAVRQRLQKEIDSKRALLIANAGLGMISKYVERGGADVLTINAPAYYRMQGYPAITGFIAVTECNALVLELAQRMKNVIQDTPVVAGIYCNKRKYGDMREYFEAIKASGYSGVMNFPSAALHDGKFRCYIDTANDLYMEMECLRAAQDMDLFTVGMAIDTKDAQIVAEARLDALICNLGYCSGDLNIPLQAAVSKVNEFSFCLSSMSPDTLLFVHGGPIRGPEEAQYIFDHTAAVGLMDGHFAVPLTVDDPLLNTVREFRCKRLR